MSKYLILSLVLMSCSAFHYNSNYEDALCICKKQNSRVFAYHTYSTVSDYVICQDAATIDIVEKCNN